MANKTISSLEQVLRNLGKWFITPFFAVGSGTITTVAMSSLSFIAGLSLPWLIPILIGVFLAETAVSIYFFKDSVPDSLVTLFLNNPFKELSPLKKILLGLGLFSVLGSGLSLGALIYNSAFAALGSILGLASFTFPPLIIGVSALLAVTGFIAISGLFFKWIHSAIKNNMHQQIVQFFKTLFSRDPDKTLTQQILESAFKLLFISLIVSLTIVGTIATLGTMQKGLIQFLSLIPKANVLAVKITSGVITFGLMGVARLPWAMGSVCSVFSALGEVIGTGVYRAGCRIAQVLKLSKTPIVEKNPQSSIKNPPSFAKSTKDLFNALAKVSAVCIHGFSFGALAQTGGGHILSETMIDLKIPLSPSAMETTTEAASIVTGGVMAAGISTYSLFAKQQKSSKKEVEEVQQQAIAASKIGFVA